MSYTPGQQVHLEKGSFDRLCVTIPASYQNGIYYPTQTIFVQESPFGSSVTIPWPVLTTSVAAPKSGAHTTNKALPVQVTPHTTYVLIPDKADLNPANPFDVCG